MPPISSCTIAAACVAVPAFADARAWAFSISAVADAWALRALASIFSWVRAETGVTWGQVGQGLAGIGVPGAAGTSTGAGTALQAARASSVAAAASRVVTSGPLRGMGRRRAVVGARDHRPGAQQAAGGQPRSAAACFWPLRVVDRCNFGNDVPKHNDLLWAAPIVQPQSPSDAAACTLRPSQAPTIGGGVFCH